MPFDYGRALVLLSFVLLAMGLCALLAIIASLVFFIFALIGLGSICLVPLVLPLVYAVLNPILGWLRANEKTPLVEFQLEDMRTGQSVSVILYRHEGSSTVHIGDQVRVYGRRQWGTGSILAHRVEVYETNGRPANHRATGKRPWPFWIGLMTLASVGVLYAYLLLESGLTSLWR